MNRKSIRGIYSKPMDATARPVIENVKLPTMGPATAPTQQAPATEGKRLMDDAHRPAADSSKPTMRPFIPGQRPSNGTDSRPTYPDQKAQATRSAADGSYVVLRMRVQDGKMIVIGSKRVEGPLLAEEALLQDGLTYEALLDNKRLSVGSIADYGEQRSYPRPGNHEHHIAVLPSFDFNLRVPSDKLTLQELPKLKISLFRFKEPVSDLKLSPLPLQAQFDRQIRVVAELNGIQVAKLPSDVQELVRRAFTQ
jgi:hypothetical protein